MRLPRAFAVSRDETQFSIGDEEGEINVWKLPAAIPQSHDRRPAGEQLKGTRCDLRTCWWITFPWTTHGNHPAYFETIGFDNPDVDKLIENPSLPAVAGTLRAKDREAAQKNAKAHSKPE